MPAYLNLSFFFLNLGIRFNLQVYSKAIMRLIMFFLELTLFIYLFFLEEKCYQQFITILVDF